MKACGVVLRTRSELTAKRNRESRAHIDEAVLARLIEERLSVGEIADRLGLTKPTVDMRMRSLGLKSKHGRGSPMERNYFWNGGVSRDVDGYVLVKVPGHPFADNRGYVREHRLVMERVLGRFLDPCEVVHHKDRNKENNDAGNLEVFRSNADHLRHELTGKTPNYTPDGLRRMRENALRVNRRRYSSSLKASESDAAE
jgi:DNA-binding transcriptional ArsR family regulator